MVQRVAELEVRARLCLRLQATPSCYRAAQGRLASVGSIALALILDALPHSNVIALIHTSLAIMFRSYHDNHVRVQDSELALDLLVHQRRQEEQATVA